MEQKGNKIKPFISSVISILLGIAAIYYAKKTSTTLCYLTASVMILAGTIYIIDYFLRPAELNFTSNNFMSGFLLIILALAAIIKVDIFAEFIPFALGLVIILNGVRELQNAIDVARLHAGSPLTILILAIINAIVGIVLIINPNLSHEMQLILLGAGLIGSGVIDFAVTFLVLTKSNKPKHPRPEE